MRRQPRAIKFLGEKPEDVETDIEFRGIRQLHGQIRYGTADSIRVGLIVDQLSASTADFDLYVDRNRDRKIEVDEKVNGQGRIREFELQTEINQGGQPVGFARKVTFRRSVDPAIFSIATHGGYASQWKVGDESLAVWRLDGDANGLFSDNRDEIWIDANNDGKWNPISERFSYRPAIVLNGERFAVRGDALGSQLDFELITGEGQLSFDVDLASEAKVQSFRASVFGDDGSCYSLESSESIELPAGNYTLGQFSIKLKPAEGQAWSYSFSHTGRASEQMWYEIEKDGEVTIPLFGNLKVEFSSPESVGAGGEIHVRPNLKTEDGLYITYSGRGEPNSYGETPHNCGKFKVTDAANSQIGTSESGFA